MNTSKEHNTQTKTRQMGQRNQIGPLSRRSVSSGIEISSRTIDPPDYIGEKRSPHRTDLNLES